jgi:hypothetical protein
VHNLFQHKQSRQQNPGNISWKPYAFHPARSSFFPAPGELERQLLAKGCRSCVHRAYSAETHVFVREQNGVNCAAAAISDLENGIT